MSSFIVSNDTINRVLAFTLTKAARTNDTFGYPARAFLGATTGSGPANRTGNPSIDTAELGQRLYDLNVQATGERYPDESADSLPGPVVKGYTYTRLVPPSPIQAYKSLGCLLYQCSEGDVPDSPLYQALQELQHGIAAALVCDLPEYNRADWA